MSNRRERPRSACSTGDLRGHLLDPDVPALRGLPKDPAALRKVLDSLPPSQEVLDFYRKKVRQFEAEEKRWQQRATQARGAVAKMAELEGQKEEAKNEVRAMRRALVEMQGAVAMERKRASKLQAENDRLKVVYFHTSL